MAASSPLPAPHCPSNCGRIEIPYPFGIGAECAWPGGGQFRVACNHSFHPLRLYTGNIEITSISVETGEMHVYAIVGSVCYNSSSTTDFNKGFVDWTLVPPFVISPTENVFTAIGCDALALLQGGSNWEYFTGCISYCASLKDAAQDGDPCTGLGCCQNSIPGNLSKIEVGWYTNNNSAVNNSAWEYSPCKHAFVAHKDWYNFSRQDLKGKGNTSFRNIVGDRSAPLVLDWAIRGNGSCQKVLGTSGVQTTTAPACVSAHSHCEDLNATRVGGYMCSKGYMGNPYINYGCTTTIVAFVAACFAVILLQRRNQRKLFNKNGGKILAANGITIYTKREVDKITKGYSKRLGGGHFGDVYHGSINGAPPQLVAVKCSVATRAARHWQKTIKHVVPQYEQEENGFVNEIIFQFKIRHTNVVKLLGCCLETQIPILVFELVSNGSLDDALHGAKKPYTLTLLKRLDIAIGSAEALNHMHSLGDHVHGDMKPANILLGEDMKPKVSDFGSSKLLSVDRYARAVAADRIYIDPVYMKTDRFTAKSDVYSFGIVLLELIKRKTAKYDENRSLSLDFIRCFKDEGSGRAMYDKDLFSGDHVQSQNDMKCLDRIGMLAIRCLKEDDEERPTMAEVVEELKQVRVVACGGSSTSDAS